ncbi:MAG TPA: hypothetical protein VHB02_15330 [Acidimicrobiales bacterium]|nr:hypothetical protein [Acidimicrobiales bacterium]
MSVQPVMTAEEWFLAMEKAEPPTEDDVTVLLDGRRLDSREAVLQWLEEVQAERSAGAASTDARA